MLACNVLKSIYEVTVKEKKGAGSPSLLLEEKTYGPKGNIQEVLCTTISKTKIQCLEFIWLSISRSVLYCLFQGFLWDTRAILNWAVDSLWELAKLASAGLRLSGLRVGEGGRRDSGGAKGEGESDDGAGVHFEE